jgi:N-acetyl-gamma-glutamyl-phosphate reductase
MKVVLILSCFLATSSAFAPRHIPTASSRSSSTRSLHAKPKIFIDGEAGTTGLQVRERLEKRSDLEILQIDESLRKDKGERKRLINEADAVILCLPDDASIEAASWVENDRTVLIDASTAFRVDEKWVYGFPGA